MTKSQLYVASIFLALTLIHRAGASADLTVTEIYFWPRSEGALNETVLASGYGATAAASATAGSTQAKAFFLVPFSAYERQISQPLTTHLCKQASKSCEKEGLTSCVVPLKRCQAQALDGGASPRSLLSEMIEADNLSAMANDADLRRSWLSYARAAVRIPTLPDDLLTELQAAVSKANVGSGACLSFSASTSWDNGNLTAGTKACDPLASDEDSDGSASAALRSVFASVWSDDAFSLRESKKFGHEAIYSGAVVNLP